MFKIKSLNRESISDDDFPVIRKEAQEEHALEKYNQALKYQRCGNSEEAEGMLQSLLDENIPDIESCGGLPKTMSTLKYSCYLNIGMIASSNGDKNKALEYLLQACELDKTDVTLWYKIGNLAMEVDRFKQAAYAYSKGLDCNKNHWPTLDKLITLLYAMRDTISCLHYISHGLHLDPDYTRGLMLRKRIYETNPGTQEYYRLYNPDSVYDPPLNTKFDEAEGKELERDSIEISERIHVLEKELGPKALPTLPLSKPLQEFTWLALGQSILHMHKYIAEHKLSFLSRLDLAKNLSFHDETENNNDIETPTDDPNKIKTSFDDINLDKNDTKVDSDINMVDEVKSNETLETEDLTMTVEAEDKEETKVIEVSEDENQMLNKDDDMNSDVQIIEIPDQDTDTDIKESEKTEKSDTSEKSEAAPEEKSKSKSACRRRRNSLSFLQPWAWHSKRKSARKLGKNDKDDTIEGSLRRIIPGSLLPNGLKSDRYKKLTSLEQDDSLNTMDLYRMFFDDQEPTSDTQSSVVIDKKEFDVYFGSQDENGDVEAFWKHPWDRCDIIQLLEKYVKELATKWEFNWPKKLKLVYLEAYDMYREHFDHPPVFGESVTFEMLKTDALITLLYAELLFDAVQSCDIAHKTICHSSITTLELICTRKRDWGSEYLSTCTRLHWLKANIFMTENNNDIAIQSLNSISYLLSTNVENTEKYYLYLPYLSRNNIVTLQTTDRILRSLEMLRNLDSLETLFENKNYDEVIQILQEAFKIKTAPKCRTKVDKPVQIVMLLHALWYTDLKECFLWSEICLNESLPQYLKTFAQPDSSDHKRWCLVVVKCLVLMEACIKEESILIVDVIKETQVRLVENLTSIICHQINCKANDNVTKIPLETVKPWILLHYILQREEHRIQAKRNIRHCNNSDDSDEERCVPAAAPSKSDDSEEDEDHDVPSSVAILFCAHDFLGRRSWCLESNGELLLFMVDVVLYRLNAPIFETIREKIEIHIEQAFFCLYQHPSKKNKVSRHLADHNVNPLSLTWERSQQLYEFYQPKALPEFDSYRYSSISGEMEQLLLRILALVPNENDPQGLLTKVTEYVNGQSDVIPEPIKFPEKINAIYYLLGDYYLKQHDPSKGLKYFMLDLCVNPGRLDTWADMALTTASQLETKLNHCESFKNESEFLDKARTAQICFKQSLQLSNGHAMLWIEYGAFVYMSHSFCSRVLKQDADTLSMEKFEILESQKEALLDTAMECFTAANIAWQAAEPGEHDERWLHHYMLGKISEKKKQDPTYYLDHYCKAGKFLFENNATYPLKINYSNPQNLSVEALEIHYRIHASILKYMELHEDRPLSKSVGKMFHKYLKESNNGLFSNPTEKPDAADTGPKRPGAELEAPAIKRRRLSELTVFEDVASTLEDILQRVESGDIYGPKEELPKISDVVMVLDSDEDNPKKGDSVVSSVEPEVQIPKIRVRNAQEIMDDMMMKCMENQPEYKSETETEVETDADKTPEKVAVIVPTPVQKVPETCSSPSRRGSTTSTAATTTTSASSSSDSSSSDDSSDTSSSSESESSETESSKQSSNTARKNTNIDAVMSSEETKKLIDQCLFSLEQCISRFPQNYKALYRLTHFYLNNKTYRDLNKCRQLLLSEYQCSDASVVTGLFSERKNTNFFNGVWRIPTSEIDRPGSFASHMSRCVQILMQVLRDTDDHKTLLDLCLQLRRTPDQDKIYIRDSERQQLSDQALSLSIQSLRNLLKKLISGKEVVIENDPFIAHETDINVKVLMAIYRAYVKVQKYLIHKESVFSNLLIDAFKHYKQNKFAEGVNVLEHAVRFCLQRKVSNRIINTNPQPQPAAPVISKPVPQGAPTPPVPQQPSPVQPIRKPTKSLTGRPRGRPPNINKHLTSAKPTKSYKDNFMSSTNPYSWQNLLLSSMGPNMNPNMAIDLMSKYFLSQYSQMGSNQMMSNPNAFANVMQQNLMNASAPMFNKDVGKNVMPPTQPNYKDVSKSVAPSVPLNRPTTSKSEMRSKSKDGSGDTKLRYSKEANKAYYVDANKDFSNDFFKDRPGISITPIHQSLPSTKPAMPKPLPTPKAPVLPTAKPQLPMKPANPLNPSGSVKTLQQKLAEKQKRNPAAQKKVETPMDLYNQMQGYQPKNVMFPKPAVPIPSKHPPSSSAPRAHSSLKNLAKNIPSSLTIMKSQPSPLPSMHGNDSGISISQVPMPNVMYKSETSKLMNFRKPSAPKLKLGSSKLGSEITVTPNYGTMPDAAHDFGVNIPMSLSVTKKDEHKTESKKEDAVEIITIE